MTSRARIIFVKADTGGTWVCADADGRTFEAHDLEELYRHLLRSGVPAGELKNLNVEIDGFDLETSFKVLREELEAWSRSGMRATEARSRSIEVLLQEGLSAPDTLHVVARALGDYVPIFGLGVPTAPAAGTQALDPDALAAVYRVFLGTWQAKFLAFMTSVGLFEYLSSGATLDDIKDFYDWRKDGTQSILAVGVASGFLRCCDGVYSSTPLAALLCPNHPDYAGNLLTRTDPKSRRAIGARSPTSLLPAPTSGRARRQRRKRRLSASPGS